MRSEQTDTVPAREQRKRRGAYYTPDALARTLVRWAVRAPDDRLLDPACGDGRFLVHHPKAVGIEVDPAAAARARERAGAARVVTGDLFDWVADRPASFDAAAGNPPFVRYQRFSGAARARALGLCERIGVRFSGLSSSWAPFLVAAASAIRPGGRMAFVVPAEIGHAPYARPLLDHLLAEFARVRIVAVRERLFPGLSEDCWLLYAEGRGRAAPALELSICERALLSARPPEPARTIAREALARRGGRLRPFLLPADVLERYERRAGEPEARRLGDVARVGIGYVSGDNAFFHLRPSSARRLGIDRRFLRPVVRNGRALHGATLRRADVDAWLEDDRPVLLLDLSGRGEPTGAVRRYLESESGEKARARYKCRTRDPWYAVPGVRVPDAFLTSLNGVAPRIVRNEARCPATNSLHEVHLRRGASIREVRAAFRGPLAQLSAEIEGHPLGGGMLKLEPREALRVLLSSPRAVDPEDRAAFSSGVRIMRSWRRVRADEGGGGPGDGGDA